MTVINKKLLEILACPADKAILKELTDTNELQCTECKRIFQVKNGIPILLLDECKNNTSS
jgi:uncharacterized protein YbaR (Trm112 family)